jgi:hypothetical protein
MILQLKETGICIISLNHMYLSECTSLEDSFYQVSSRNKVILILKFLKQITVILIQLLLDTQCISFSSRVIIYLIFLWDGRRRGCGGLPR